MKLKKLSSIKILLIPLLVFASIVSCATKHETTGFEKKFYKPQFSRVQKKSVIALLYFKDARKDVSKIKAEDDEDIYKNLIQQATSLAEEILVKDNGFSSVTVISPIDLKDLNDASQLSKINKVYNLDYIFAGEIEEAKLEKIKLDSSFSYKFGVFFSTGIFPEPYEYRSRFVVKGKLISALDNKTLWKGGGKSYFAQNRNLLKNDVFIVSMKNALNRMFSDMSKVFNLQIKEIN